MPPVPGIGGRAGTKKSSSRAPSASDLAARKALYQSELAQNLYLRQPGKSYTTMTNEAVAAAAGGGGRVGGAGGGGGGGALGGALAGLDSMAAQSRADIRDIYADRLRDIQGLYNQYGKDFGVPYHQLVAAQRGAGREIGAQIGSSLKDVQFRAGASARPMDDAEQKYLAGILSAGVAPFLGASQAFGANYIGELRASKANYKGFARALAAALKREEPARMAELSANLMAYRAALQGRLTSTSGRTTRSLLPTIGQISQARSLGIDPSNYQSKYALADAIGKARAKKSSAKDKPPPGWNEFVSIFG